MVTRGRGRGMGLALRAVLGPLIDVEQFVLADHDDIAVIEVVVAHALGVHEDAVGAVEVLDHAVVGRGDDLLVVPAADATLDLQVVGRGAVKDQTAAIQRALAAGATTRYGIYARQRP